MIPATRPAVRARSARQHPIGSSEGLDDHESGEKGGDELAAHVLVSMSEAASADLSKVEVVIYNHLGKVSTLSAALQSPNSQ